MAEPEVIADLRQEVKELETESETLTHANDKMESDGYLKDEQIEELTKERDDFEKERDDFETEKNEFEEKFDKSEEKVEGLEYRIEELEECEKIAQHSFPVDNLHDQGKFDELLLLFEHKSLEELQELTRGILP